MFWCGKAIRVRRQNLNMNTAALKEGEVLRFCFFALYGNHEDTRIADEIWSGD